MMSQIILVVLIACKYCTKQNTFSSFVYHTAISAGFHSAIDTFLPVQVHIAVPRINSIMNNESDYPCCSDCLQILH